MIEAIHPILLLASLILGVLLSLLPGLHPNSIGAILTPWLGGETAWAGVLVALLGVRLAMQFLPSLLVGTPAGQTEWGTLPGVRLMREGRGPEALAICAWSVALATLAALAFAPLLIPILPSLFALVKPWVGYLLIIASATLILTERKWRKIERALIVFLLATGLGMTTLDLPMNDPLFALFVGFFTMPALLAGEDTPSEVEEMGAPETPSRDILPFIALGVLLGGLADLLPGLSTPAQVAGLASLVVPLEQPAHFLALAASIEASHTVFAFASAATSGVARIGVVAIIGQNTALGLEDLPVLLGVLAVSAAVGAAALVWIGRWILPRWHRLDWRRIQRLLGAYLIVMVFLLDGWLGLLVLTLATAIGTLPVRWGVKRTQVMGSLIGPAILHAFGM